MRGWMGRWMDGWKDGWMHRYCSLFGWVEEELGVEKMSWGKISDPY